MGIGLGVSLIIAGVVLVAGVFEFDIAGVAETNLGWILIAGGILALVLGFAQTRRRTTVVEDRPVAGERTVTERTERTER